MAKRTAGLVLLLSLIGCTSPTVVIPSPSPTRSAAATAATSPAASPTASPRALRPFAGVLPIASLADTALTLAPDRGRIAFVHDQGQLAVLDAGSDRPRTVHRPQDGFGIVLDRDGLRGDRLVFLETRTDGQRTDSRVVEMDLRSGAARTLDDFSGPFLGGGDTWRPRAPVTNGEDVAWVRVDAEGTPFGVHVVLQQSVQGGPRVIHSGTSALWIDLADRRPTDADARLLISTLVGQGEVAELILWQSGTSTPLGSRPSGEGGPALFVGEKAFWQRGSGIVARSEGGELIDPSRQVRRVDFPACATSGSVGRYLLLHCGSSTVEAALLDPDTGERYALPGVGHVAGSRAVVWREGAQWWLGTIAP